MWFLRELREYVTKHGSKNIVYIDESGFAANSYRSHGWAERGVKVFGDITGNNRKGRTNLIMAQRGNEWLAPMLFEGSCHKAVVNTWMKEMLLAELIEPSLIVMDNAPFHDKAAIAKLLEENGHRLLPLPSYSPDFNPIEQSFAVIKKRREYSNLPLSHLLHQNQNMGNYYIK